MNAKVTLLIAGLVTLAHLDSKSAIGQTSSPTQIPEYMIVDFDTLGGTSTYVYGINDHGQVVGSSQTRGDLYRHAFFYSNGSMNDIGTLGGDNSYAFEINNSGQAVGYSQIKGNLHVHSFLYSNGILHDIGTLGGNNTYAYGINDKGQIAGYSELKNGDWHAFLYSNGILHDIGTLGGKKSFANGINNSGQVVGYSWNVDEIPHAFLYSNGSMLDLGTLGGRESFTSDINNRGHVTGSAHTSNGILHSFLYSNGVMKDIGTLGDYFSYAYGINDHGQVVGASPFSRDPDALHAFLYSDGVMRDLNNLVIPGSGWNLELAGAINNTGKIVGHGINPSGQRQAFLLNPLPVGWRKALAETTPTKPTYGICPDKKDGKDSLVVVTHGWQPAWKPVDISWVVEMTNSIVGYLQNHKLNNWQVHAQKWVEKANVPIKDGGPEKALKNAEDEGLNLGKRLATEGWTHIHLIGHSAGSALIQAVCETIKIASPGTTVHLTFLDPFVGFVYGGRNLYGKKADWFDNYFSQDLETGGEMYQLTEGPLDFTYNVDVTWLDTKKVSRGTYRSSWNGDMEECYRTFSSHEWPYEFYLWTIGQPGRADGFGFALSKEGGNWDFAKSQYQKGNNPSLSLGTPDPSCSPDITLPPPNWNPILDFTKPLIIKSSTGLNQISATSITLVTGSPVWIATVLEITNAVNLVSFEAEFKSASGAEGLLSVFWDTNTVGSLDERVTPSGLRVYHFPLPETVTNGVRMLGFRLDAFSAVQSSVTITNVTLGFSGMREPFTLAVTDTLTNGLPVLQLTGPAGFNYTVESGTNLLDWKTIAVLVNTNGSVRFVDSSATNTTARFYRAVAP